MSKVNTSWVLKLFDKVSKPMRRIKKSTDSATKSGNRLDTCFKRIKAIDFYAVGQGIQNLNQQLQQAIQPGVAFQSGLAEVSALTGVVGDKLDDLGKKARKSALMFGGTAADSLDNYKTLMSRLGPQLAKTPELLEEMEHNVRTLSKTMGGDTKGAVDALTTSLLQYQVDLDDSQTATDEMSRMMNVMAAGAQEGAAEVSSVSASLKESGVQLKQSKVGFEEANAALQALAAGGKEGSKAGIALRNVLARMAGEDVISDQAAEKLKALGVDFSVVSDTSLSFTDRLRELKKAEGDATVMAQVFGLESASSAKILLNSVDAQDELAKKITGTTSAQEQAMTIMDTYAEKMNRLNAWFKDLGISIFNATKKALPFVDVLGKVAFTGSQIGTVFSGLGPVLSNFNSRTIRPLITRLRRLSFTSVGASASVETMGLSSFIATPGVWSLTGAIKALSKAIYSIPVVGWILAIIAALVALFTYLWNNSRKFRGVIYGIWNVIKLVFGKIMAFIKPILKFLFEGFKTTFSGIWNVVKNVVSTLWNFIKTAFAKIRSTIAKVLNTIKTVFKTVFGSVYTAVVKVFKKIWEKVKYYMDKILGPIKKAGKIVKGLWDKIFGKSFSEEVAGAMKEGQERADAEFDAKEKKKGKQGKEPEASGLKEFLSGKTTGISQTKNIGNTGKGKEGSVSGAGLSIAGKGSGGSNITMTINNYFNADGDTDIRSLADKVAGRINDVLQDAVVAI